MKVMKIWPVCLSALARRGSPNSGSWSKSVMGFKPYRYTQLIDLVVRPVLQPTPAPLAGPARLS